MNNGETASFQDNSAHGEDAFLIRELSQSSSLDVVLDGVTHCEGGYASGFTVQLIQEAPVESLADLLDTLESANRTLFQGGRGRRLLTTISAALKIENGLQVIHLGDSPVYLIRNGEARELTHIVQEGLLPGVISAAVGLHEVFNYEQSGTTIIPGDRLVLATDGLINNIFPQEIADIVSNASTPHEAVSALRELVGEKRRRNRGRDDSYGTFREDDRTAIIRYFD